MHKQRPVGYNGLGQEEQFVKLGVKRAIIYAVFGGITAFVLFLAIR